MMGLPFELDDANANKPTKVKIAGVGHSGLNSLNRMIYRRIANMEEFISLGAKGDDSSAPETLLASLDDRITSVGTADEENELKNILRRSDLIYIVGDLGESLCEKTYKTLARIAKETGAMMIAVVTMPVSRDGEETAVRAADSMKDIADLLICLDAGSAAYESTGDAISQTIELFQTVLFKRLLVNIDFEDFRQLFGRAGLAFLGVGNGHGINKVTEATQKALISQTAREINGVAHLMFVMTGGDDTHISEAEKIIDVLRDFIDDDTEILWSMIRDPDMRDTVTVTILAD
jgi:cell division protein FtsZ